MSGVAVLRRQQRHEQRKWNPHRTKAEHADSFRGLALSLMEYADNPEAAASALKALDRADQLELSPRAGWYPRRPRGWRP